MQSTNDLRNFSVIYVFFFWLLVLGILNQTDTSNGIISIHWSDFAKHQMIAILALILSLCIATFLQYRSIVLNRSIKVYELQAQSHMGLRSSLGSAHLFLSDPWLQGDPKSRSEEDSNDATHWLKEFKKHRDSESLLSIVSQMEISHALHAKAMLGCLKLLSQTPLCPAYHGLNLMKGLSDEDAQSIQLNVHGRVSLLDHAMRVCMIGIQMANGFEYQGIRGEYNKIAKRDSSYQLSPFDPMIPLICLSHDMGKLITYKRSANGRVIEVQGLHGQVGARALAQTSFIKALPMQDQSALYKALYFYHHPLDYTLDHEAKIENDREAALMMLLIKADHAASMREFKSTSKKE
jgi:hypothetical protein